MRIYQKCRSLARLEGTAFINEVYKEILQREADPVGLQHSLKSLRQGMSKQAILTSVLLTEEAKSLYHPSHCPPTGRNHVP